MADLEKSFIEKVNIVAANIVGVAAVNENLPAILSAKDQADLATLKASEAAASAAEIKELSVQVSTLSPSEPASAVYDPLNGVLHIEIPKGDTGTQGVQGIAGVDGSDGISAYQVALNNGFVGTEIEWVASLKGEQGLQGIAGADGTMTFTDLTPEQVASLKGEQGLQGIAGVDGSDGISAYQVALNNGFVGTEVEWIASLKGEQGLQGIAGADGTMTFTDLTPEQVASLKGEQGLQGIAGVDGSDGISAYQVALNNGFVGTEVEWIASLKGEQGLQGIKGDTGAQGATGINGTNGTSDTNFTKPFQGAPIFTKSSVSTITIPIGTSVKAGANIITVSGAVYTLSLNSVGVGALDTGAKAAGTDYYVYALEAGGFILSANATNPTGYTTANSRKIGGFHYGVIPEAFTAINNIVAADATNIAGINAYSLWDLKFKPVCDPKGMVFILGRWYDIYLLNTDHHTYGTSAAGKTIAGGTVLNGRNFPKIPLFYGGNGTTTYGTLTWFEAAEIGKAYSKDMISYNEFVAIAYGVLEATSAGAADTGVTQHLANFTSKFGLCMATGCQYIWGKDVGNNGAASAWSTNTEGRGSLYGNAASPAAAIFGGYRDYTVESGSRCSNWVNYVWSTSWSIGCRYACDHLELA